MMVQAGTFMLPYRIWRFLEGGLMEEFGTDAKTAIILDEEYGDEAVVMDSVVDKYVKFFRQTWHRNNWYFFALKQLKIHIFFLFWGSDSNHTQFRFNFGQISMFSLILA